jgi:hypothetical protein
MGTFSGISGEPNNPLNDLQRAAQANPRRAMASFQPTAAEYQLGSAQRPEGNYTLNSNLNAGTENWSLLLPEGQRHGSMLGDVITGAAFMLGGMYAGGALGGGEVAAGEVAAGAGVGEAGAVSAADLAAADTAAGLIPAGEAGSATLAGGGTGIGTEMATVGGTSGTTAGTAGATPAATTPTTTAKPFGFMDAVQIAAPLVTTLIQSDANKDAIKASTDASNAAIALQKTQYDTTRADQVRWRAAGENALNKLMGLLNDGSLTSKFGGMNPQEEAGYAFQAREGQRAIENSASARGGFGGDVLKAGARYAEENANRHYNDAFNRFQTERTNTTNPLFQIAGFGTQANQQVQAAGQNAANNSGNALIGAGQDQGAGAINRGNIYSDTINQLAGIGANRWNTPPKG